MLLKLSMVVMFSTDGIAHSAMYNFLKNIFFTGRRYKSQESHWTNHFRAFWYFKQEIRKYVVLE